MLTNLTLIIAAYIFVRLTAEALRQFPKIEAGAKVTIAVLSAAAIILVILCALDTLGVAVSVGSTIEMHRH